jgi:hypothetical protein
MEDGGGAVTVVPRTQLNAVDQRAEDVGGFGLDGGIV